MSISPTSPYTTYSTSTPEATLERAKALCQKRLREESLEPGEKVVKWAIEATAKAIEETDNVLPIDIDNYMSALEDAIPLQMENINKINWSRSYEQEERTFPTIKEFQPIADWLVQLEDKYDVFLRKKKDTFRENFLDKMSGFINHFTNQIQKAAISSREASLAKLLAQQPVTNSLETEESHTPTDLEVETQITIFHINNLNKNKTEAAFLELRDLLNLSRKESTARKPSMDEQTAFRFLFSISQPLIKKEKNNSGPSSLPATHKA